MDEVFFRNKTIVRILEVLVMIMPILLLGCKKDEVTPTVFEIPQEVESYVNRFFDEAQSRSIPLTKDNLIIELSDEPILVGQQNSCGITYGTITGENQNRIQIDTECLAWRHSDVSREILLFHELAHALLQRDHENSQLPNLDWKSIMVGINWSIDDFYVFDHTKRDYYIDELFNPETELPEWSK